MTARRIGESMTKQGFSVIVENSPGASGTIGLRKVATSAPDGYTLGIATTSLMGAMSKKITPLTTKDFTPLVQMTAEQMVLLVRQASPVKTIEAFVELMNSKSVSFGTPGAYTDRKSVVKGTRVPVRVDRGGRGSIKKKNQKKTK